MTAPHGRGALATALVVGLAFPATAGPPPPPGRTAAALAADGRRLAWTDGTEVRLIDPPTDSDLPPPPRPAGPVVQLRFTPDGALAVLERDGPALRLTDPATGQEPA